VTFVFSGAASTGGVEFRVAPLMLQAVAFLISVGALLWSRSYAKLLLRNWFPRIDDALLDDMADAGERVAMAQSAALTALAVLVNVVAVLSGKSTQLLGWQELLVGGAGAFALLALLYSFMSLPSAPLTSSETGDDGRSQIRGVKAAVWCIVLVTNLTMLGLVWVL